MAAKGKTYAQEAKAIMNKYKLRLGDKFDKRDNMSLEAMNQELAALRERQEATREAKLGASDFGKANGEGLTKLDGLAPTQDLNQVGIQYASDFGGDYGAGTTDLRTPGD